MRHSVQTARPEETVQEAARRMREADVGFLPVCDPDGKVVGAVTDRDLAVRVCAENLAADKTRVGEVMSTGLVACRPEHPIGYAERLMAEHRKQRVLVTDRRGRLLGVISLSDIAQYDTPARLSRAMLGLTARKYAPEAP